jgi:hypothetical protein
MIDDKYKEKIQNILAELKLAINWEGTNKNFLSANQAYKELITLVEEIYESKTKNNLDKGIEN